MIEQLSTLIHDLSLVFLAISPTVFVFSVTLLGDAIERSQQEEKAARENDKKNIQDDITKVEKALQSAKKDGNTTTLTDELEDLKKKQTQTEKKINDIKIKYSSIDFSNTVLYPCAAFLLSLAARPLIVFFGDKNQFSSVLVIVSQLLLISYGIIKIYKSLRLVQEISANKKEGEHYDRLKETFKLALFEYYQSNKEDVLVEFIDKAFPLNVATSMELAINFRVKLTKGSVLQNACVWFYVSDGLELIDPPEKDSWRQRSDYTPPNIRTVKISLGTLSIGPWTPRILKLKTPATAGKYLLRYAVRADGYFGSMKDLTLLVG